MDIGLMLIGAIVTFIIGIIIKYFTGIEFNKLLALLGLLTFFIPFIIGYFYFINVASHDINSATDYISNVVKAFADWIVGFVIGDVAALLVSSFLEPIGIKP